MSLDQYLSEGYTIVPSLCPPEDIKKAKKAIQRGIDFCVADLDVPLEKYLRVASRWVDPSPVTEEIIPIIEGTIRHFVENFLGSKVVNAKNNVISKTKYATGSVPCHQDISYSASSPYEFSVWMPVDDVTVDSGVLQMLPGSHLEPIAPPVDFWQKDFIDEMARSKRWIDGHVDLPLKAGDAVLFDSRIWHGSSPSISKKDRFAIVSRWSSEGYSNTVAIPEKLSSTFGMWTAGGFTAEALQEFNGEKKPYNETIDLAIAKLKSYDNFRGNTKSACETLGLLKLLNVAAERHNAGDALGVIYPQVWNEVLRYL